MISSSQNRLLQVSNGDIQSGTSLNQEVGIKQPIDTRWGSHFGSLLNIKSVFFNLLKLMGSQMILTSRCKKKDHDIVKAVHQVRSFKDMLNQMREEG
uniref:Uncharacterized protein n=1 Tax=Lactuca sativa TaxID=4236 RepID=A0A9R1UGJ4_LACSA|nr:hypothetical protein LSAT_V11C900458470 [Lactuca sativa]